MAIVFGVATVIAGARVLAGADPGYAVFRPLLLYNTAMGVAYVLAGIVAWRDLGRGARASATILALNALVLAALGYLHRTGGAVAVESLRAMTLRTAVWLVVFLVLAWLSSSGRPRGGGAAG